MSEDTRTQARAAGADDLTIAASAAPDTPHLPTSIASFRVIRLIGAGGMGAVYEAEQAMPRRIVALKVIRPGLVTPDLRRRFDNEVEVLGRLQHPGIARIYQAGVTDLGGGPQPYFAMELVPGLALADYAARRGLGSRERLRLMAAVCDAVQHAHQRGVIHRDLKPGNILVDEASGEPKILDFGIARTTDPDLQMTSYTMFGQLVGTLPYMSPEQLSADPSSIDTRSDVYALGVILYELLTGKLPHDLTRRSTIDAMTAIRDVEPTRLGSLDRRLRGDVETIVAKALEKEKDRRYASAAELAADIRRYLDDQPIVARPPSAAYQLRKFARRNKALVGGVAAAFVILVGGVIASTWQAVRATRAERLAGTRLVEADQARGVAQTRAVEATDARQLADQRRDEAEANFLLAEEARARAEQQREANRQLLYVSDLNLAQRLWNEGDYPRLVDLLARHQAQPGVTDLRGFEWFHLWHATHLHRREFQLSSFLQAASATADGATIVAGDAGGEVGLWDTKSGRRLLTLKGPPVSSIAVSEDGRTLAIGTRTGILRVVDAASGRDVTQFTSEKPGAVGRLQFSGDGRALYASMVGMTKVWDLATTRELLSHPGLGMFVPSVSEPRVVVPRTATTIAIRSPAGEQPVTIDGRLRDVAVSGDGSRVIVFAGDGTITVVNAAGEVMRTFRPEQAYTPPFAASRTGRLLAVRTTMGVLLIDAEAGKSLASVPASANLRRIDFSPNEQLLLMSDDTGITLFDVPGRRVRTIVRGHATAALTMRVASDDRTLITAGSDSIKVWDLASVSPVERLDQGPGMVDDITVSLDGRSLASATYFSSTAGINRTTIAVWDLASGRQTASRQFADRAAAVAFAGSTVVAGDLRGGLVFWRLDQTVEPQTVAAHGQLVRSIERSADGTRVASASGGEVKVWDVATRRLVTTLPHREVRAAAFAPDGSRLATAGFDRAIRIWTLGGRAAPREIPGPGQGVWSLAWSSDGRLLASADETGGVHVWRVSDGAVITRLRAHTERATTVSFSRDGRRLLTGSTDGIVRLWDLETWSEVAQYAEQTDSITAAAFALDGNAIVAGTNLSAVLMWRAADRSR